MIFHGKALFVRFRASVSPAGNLVEFQWTATQEMVASNEQDLQHLLSPYMSSPELSYGQPSPLKPLHLLSQDHSTDYQPAPTSEDFEPLKEVQVEDAVRHSRKLTFKTQPPTQPLISPEPEGPRSPPAYHVPAPLTLHIHRRPHPHNHNPHQVPHHKIHLPRRHPQRANHIPHRMG